MVCTILVLDWRNGVLIICSDNEDRDSDNDDDQ